MKKILCLVLLFSSLLLGDTITTSNKVADEKEICKQEIKLQDVKQSGCCSWHGGVSGCSSSGRVVCNDGTYSPSCTCNKSINPLG